MQFVRSQIAALRPSESRSVALWNQLGWFSASKTYAASQQPNCASAVEAKQVIFSRKIDSTPPLRCRHSFDIARQTAMSVEAD